MNATNTIPSTKIDFKIINTQNLEAPKAYIYTYQYFIPDASNIRLAAIVSFLCACLSDIYITSRIPDWIMILAHSLHGNKPTYIVQFVTFALFLFITAFISAWHTENKILHNNKSLEFTEILPLWITYFYQEAFLRVLVLFFFYINLKNYW